MTRSRHPLLLSLLLLSAPVTGRSESMLPTAQELIAIIEVGGEQCVKSNLITAANQVSLQKHFSSLLKKRTYQQYLQTAEYVTARGKAVEDIAKNGLDRELCKWLTRIPSIPPGDLMFFEPGV